MTEGDLDRRRAQHILQLADSCRVADTQRKGFRRVVGARLSIATTASGVVVFKLSCGELSCGRAPRAFRRLDATVVVVGRELLRRP